MLDTQWHYAVVVGIDEYPEHSHLPCARADAEAMAEWLTATDGGKIAPANVKLITRLLPAGRQPPVPMRREIAQCIVETVRTFYQQLDATYSTATARKEAWEKSRFFFFISGHGIDSDGEDAAVLTADANKSFLEHISTASVMKHLKKESSFAELIVIVDSCRDPSTILIGPLPLNLPGKKYVASGLPRTFTARSCRTQRKAYEPEPGNPDGITLGYFTHVLLEGLRGQVAGSVVNSTYLSNYIFNRLAELAAKYVLKPDGTPDTAGQAPEILVDQEIVFSYHTTTFPVQLTAFPGSAWATHSALEAVTFVNDTLVRHPLQAATHGVFKGHLPSGTYSVIPPGANPLSLVPPPPSFTVLGKEVDETLP